MTARSRLLSAVRAPLRRAGVDLVRYEPRPTLLSHTVRLLRDSRATVVFDVGANTGQFVKSIRAGGYQGRVVSFEPLSEAYASLRVSAATDPAWEVVNVALGDTEGRLLMHVAGNSQSSSFLDMLPLHRRAAPGSAYLDDEQVDVSTLASMIDRLASGDDRLFVKIDTQGYESQVLDGAGPQLARVVGMQVEMSLVPLYEGQDLLEHTVARLRGEGFMLVWIEPVFWDEETGRLLQVDGVFARG